MHRFKVNYVFIYINIKKFELFTRKYNTETDDHQLRKLKPCSVYNRSRPIGEVRSVIFIAVVNVHFIAGKHLVRIVIAFFKYKIGVI